MRSLLLIKHSLPEILKTVPAREWHLSEEGRRRCEKLAEVISLFTPRAIVTSLEPKAMETGQLTAERLQCPFFTADGLHEHDRSNEPFLSRDELEANVKWFFEKSELLVLGNETANEAHARFEKAINDVLATHPEGNLAIVAHGTVISLYISRLTGMDPFLFWKRLGLPSLVELFLPDKRLVRVIKNIETNSGTGKLNGRKTD